MEYELVLNSATDIERQDGEPMPTYLSQIIKQLLSNSAQRQLSLNFTEQNRLQIAEEIGYRRALQELATFYQDEHK